MSVKSLLFPLLLAGILGLFGLPTAKTNPASAQEGPQPPKKLTKSYFGIGDCRRCHTTPEELEPILCKCDEVRTWEKLDKHKDAQIVLLGERSKQMAAILKIGEIAKEPKCVSCHVGVVGSNPLVTKSFKPSEGVSCVICHGPYKEWVGPHGLETEREMWRKLTRQQKEASYGLIDLWDPVKRAALCASCHIGNAGEGKVVTHAMYAAGHPPLPGLEVATFSDAMPRHWQYLAEKKPGVQKILGYDPEKSSLERSELVLVAGLVSLRESMNLLADQAQGGTSWPELAQFDCYACHHDLKVKSWRQERGYSGKPGRPSVRSWPTVLVELGTFEFSGDGKTAELKALLGELTVACDVRPFGEPKKVAASARKLAGWVDRLLPAIRERRIDREAARRLVNRLCALPEEKLPDYDSARQIAWAFRVLGADAYPKQMNAPGIVKDMTALDEQLKLGLPQGQVRIVDSLRDSLGRIGGFDPDRFQRTMRDLAAKTQQLEEQ
jgi:hypothetical protein